MYLFFDTETTGLPKDYNAPPSNVDNWPRIVQLAWAIYNKDEFLVMSNSFIVDVGQDVPTAATDIHGITTEMTREYGDDIEAITNIFYNTLGLAEFLIAHNLNFDQAILRAEYFRQTGIDKDWSPPKQVCTMRSSTDFCKLPGKFPGKYKWPKLQELHTILFNEEFQSAHNAMMDVFACARCFFELKKRGVIK